MEQTQDAYEEQLKTFEDRCDFLKDWIEVLESTDSGFEGQNKVFHLQMELDNKLKMIEVKKRNKATQEGNRANQKQQLEQAFPLMIEALRKTNNKVIGNKKNDLKQGIIKRFNDNSYANESEKARDFMIGKEIIG